MAKLPKISRKQAERFVGDGLESIKTGGKRRLSKREKLLLERLDPVDDEPTEGAEPLVN